MKRVASDRVDELERLYGSDEALGVEQDAEGIARLPDGGAAVNCYDCASYIRSRERDTAVFGFFTEDNPAWAGARHADGHDFALVAGRYIVDPWIVEERLSRRAVFDLLDADDAGEVRRLYGRRSRWKLVEHPSRHGLDQRAASQAGAGTKAILSSPRIRLVDGFSRG